AGRGDLLLSGDSSILRISVKKCPLFPFGPVNGYFCAYIDISYMRRALVLFYFLVFYAVMQLFWWGYLLVNYEPDRKGMIIGEGVFFLLIFFWGALRLKKLFTREHKQQQLHQNFLLSVTLELKSPLASVNLYIQTNLKLDLIRKQPQMFLSN